MQCVSCRFENMPGVGVCGRCGSPLGLHDLAIDVHPPRAGAWTKRWRRWLPLRSWYFKVREVGNRRVFEDGDREEFGGTRVGILFRLLIPGWAHLHQGRRTQAFLFFGIWLAFVLLAVASFFITLSGISLYQRMNQHELENRGGGLSVGGMFLGLALSVHLVSCLSVARLDGVESREFLRGSGRGLIMILAGLYLLCGWLLFSVLLQMS